MEQLEKNYNQFLPLNRKERYYTGTILPYIICYQDFKHIQLFFNLINNFPKNILIKPDTDQNNIQFNSEFSLKESVNFSGKKYKDVPVTKETPDIVILITKPELFLIVVEAKMFSSTQPHEFKEQVEAQKKMIDCIKNNLEIKQENIFHLGLVPKEYFSKNITTNCQIIFWEDIIEAYKGIMNKNYFYETLRYALKNYKTLISSNSDSFGSFGQNMEDKLSGIEILKLHESGKEFWVGRNRGLNGPELRTDKESGGWKTYKYEVNFKDETAPNRNWFGSKEFVKFINDGKIIPEEILNENQTDSWHFSYLGKEYFEKVSEILGFGGTLNCQIKALHTGNKGVKYKDKLLGRKINPNWIAVLSNGKQFRYGTHTKNKLEEGSFSFSGYKRNSWDDIKNYNW